ncbi:hypothetical protein E2C01_050976 [Portunus trituberculatus]|uniref:Uncharacterized protein n=1 Tax=Portunus trituberculatus TaxID=210409 RepID=A0A5B7GIY6_PORTR|nr:hypothetical protein [Portunus trituberculatus]
MEKRHGTEGVKCPDHLLPLQAFPAARKQQVFLVSHMVEASFISVTLLQNISAATRKLVQWSPCVAQPAQ